MTKMTDTQLIAIVNEAERDSLVDGTMTKLAEDVFDRYTCQPYGNEESDRSQVVSSEVSDVVEADMPSLARVFMGAGDVCQFKPTSSNPLAIQEAEEKQVYIPWIVDNVKNSFKTQHDWLKSSELQPFAMLEYGIETIKKADEKMYRGITPDVLASYMADFEAEDDITDVDIIERTEGEEEFDITIKLKRERQEYFLKNINFEDIIISRNAIDKDADVIGYRWRKSRSDLIAEGYDKDLVMSLPTVGERDDDSTLKQKRHRNEGGEQENSTLNTPANELVDGVRLFMSVDFDGDGVAERRLVIQSGNKLLKNEVFDHVPFAIISSILMPNTLAGRSRGELELSHAEIQTFLKRGIMNNITQVNNPRTAIDENAGENIVDDTLDAALAGVIRVNGDPRMAIMPVTVPYIGGEVMQVSQYFDAAASERTGNQLTNQGLDSDQLTQETATRFEGIEAVGQAKIELVARVIAEVGYRDLYEGLAWFASHFQNKEQEIFVLGKPLTVDPNKWRFDHRVVAEVGTGAGDDQKSVQVLSGIYSAQTQLINEGSTLSDESKRYNTLKKMTQKLGLNSPEPFFNDPSQPDQVVLAENGILKKQVAAISQQLEANNPLIAMEQVKAGAKQQGDQLKGEIQMQQLLVKMQQDRAQMQADNQKFMAELMQKQEQFFAKETREWATLEVENNTDIEGQGI